jgi:hypothetical protein
VHEVGEVLRRHADDGMRRPAAVVVHARDTSRRAAVRRTTAAASRGRDVTVVPPL